MGGSGSGYLAADKSFAGGRHLSNNKLTMPATRISDLDLTYGYI